MIEIGRSGCAPAQRRRKAAGGALLILMAGLTGCAPKLAQQAPPPLVTVAQPITRRIIDWDDYVGQFVAPESVEVRPRVAGYIQSIAFKDGAEVRKGDLLFVIDPRPYKAVLDQAKAQQQHAQAAVQGAEIEERRAEGLVEAKADGALATFDGTVLTALKEVEQALATYSGELHRHESLSASQAAAVATLTLGQVRYRRGSLSFLDFIALERTAVETEAELAASNSALANDQVAVFKALGGGWEAAPAIESRHSG
jgi:multidrug efflux pump subunit AcrA (membrane-fusion protein)